MEKTNAMRQLDQKKIKYETKEYPHQEGEAVDGLTVARSTGENPDQVFKTLVTVGNDKKNYVFVVPVSKELDLKKCAKAVGVKNVELIEVKQINQLTGYIRGGCSPLGMKKTFHTVVDETALLYDEIMFSGGKIGLQIKMNPLDLNKLIKVEFKDIKEG